MDRTIAAHVRTHAEEGTAERERVREREGERGRRGESGNKHRITNARLSFSLLLHFLLHFLLTPPSQIHPQRNKGTVSARNMNAYVSDKEKPAPPPV